MSTQLQTIVLAISESAFANLKTVLLVIFFTAFVGLLIWLAVTKTSKFNRTSRLPLDDDHVDRS